MTAAEAKTLADRAHPTPAVPPELLVRIRELAEQGKYEYTPPKWMPTNVVEGLVALGYRVEVKYVNTFWTDQVQVISWG